MKKLTIFAAIAFVFALSSCNKAKDCKCTTFQQWDIEDMTPMTTESTLHIDKGECSDNNITSSMEAMGQHYTQTIECVEI